MFPLSIDKFSVKCKKLRVSFCFDVCYKVRFSFRLLTQAGQVSTFGNQDLVKQQTKNNRENDQTLTVRKLNCVFFYVFYAYILFFLLVLFNVLFYIEKKYINVKM